MLGGRSYREYEAAAEAVPEAISLAPTSVSRRFVRASARELQERRLDDAAWLVVVLDGAKGQRAAERCSATCRCCAARGTRGKVVSHLAKREQPMWRRKRQAAYAQSSYAAARQALTRLQHELQLRNASAATSLAEGLGERLTLDRLGVSPELSVSFKTTNLIERVMARLEAKTQRVTRWRTSDQKLRWCAAALCAMERQCRRVKGYRHLALLKQVLATKLPASPAAAT